MLPIWVFWFNQLQVARAGPRHLGTCGRPKNVISHTHDEGAREDLHEEQKGKKYWPWDQLPQWTLPPEAAASPGLMGRLAVNKTLHQDLMSMGSCHLRQQPHQASLEGQPWGRPNCDQHVEAEGLFLPSLAAIRKKTVILPCGCWCQWKAFQASKLHWGVGVDFHSNCCWEGRETSCWQLCSCAITNYGGGGCPDAACMPGIYVLPSVWSSKAILRFLRIFAKIKS